MTKGKKEENRVFTVASDENLINLIQSAENQLVVVCPALTEPVAKALRNRLRDEGKTGITVILDADSEAYRLGYGTAKALDELHAASTANFFDLRYQEGVRIGMVISDATVMVFSPVPLLIEAGSTSNEKPNAIVFSDDARAQLASAAGASLTETENLQEIGKKAMTSHRIEAVKKSLKENPPQSVNISRLVRVLSSKVQYVEFEIKNYRLTRRRVPLPPDLLNISDGSLKKKISGRLRLEDIESVRIKVKTLDDKVKTLSVNEKWFEGERKRIEDKYTFAVLNFGRIILYTKKEKFKKEIEFFEENLDAYQKAIRANLEEARKKLEDKMFDEFLTTERRKSLEASLNDYGEEPTEENIEREFRKILERTLKEAFEFKPPQVRIVYKNIASESVSNPYFCESLKNAMYKIGVPDITIESLFEHTHAAPAKSYDKRGRAGRQVPPRPPYFPPSR